MDRVLVAVIHGDHHTRRLNGRFLATSFLELLHQLCGHSAYQGLVNRKVRRLEKRAYWKGSDDIVNTYAPHGTSLDTWPVLGFCFGFEGNELDNLRAGLHQLDTEDLGSNLDMLCVLTQGCVGNAAADADGSLGAISGAPSPGTRRISIANQDAGMGAGLMFFYLLAGGLLMQARTAPINMGRYLGRPGQS
jgi:hypothetical protein